MCAIVAGRRKSHAPTPNMRFLVAAALLGLASVASATPAKFDVSLMGTGPQTVATFKDKLAAFLTLPASMIASRVVPPTAAAAYPDTVWVEFSLDVADTKRREALEYQLLNATVPVQVGMLITSLSNNVPWDTTAIPATAQWRLINVTARPGVTEGTVMFRANATAEWGYVCAHGIGAFVPRAICGTLFGLNATMPANSAIPLMDRCVPGPMNSVHTFCEEGAVTAMGPACRHTTQWLPNAPPPHVHALGGEAGCLRPNHPCGLGVRCYH